ncbi:Omega-amino acid--pyruvate aminotransferase [compost metagenome]
MITGFGRIGEAFAAQRWGVTPDILTSAKGLTNGAVPMGAVFVDEALFDAFMGGPDGIELFHGYTYSGHPLACAAALAALDIYQGEGLFQRAIELEDYWCDALLGLRDLPHVVDIRCVGLVGAVQLAADPAGAGRRGQRVFEQCFRDGALVRCTGDTLALSPPLIIEREQIDRLLEILAGALRQLA